VELVGNRAGTMTSTRSGWPCGRIHGYMDIEVRRVLPESLSAISFTFRGSRVPVSNENARTTRSEEIRGSADSQLVSTREKQLLRNTTENEPWATVYLTFVSCFQIMDLDRHESTPDRYNVHCRVIVLRTLSSLPFALGETKCGSGPATAILEHVDMHWCMGLDRRRSRDLEGGAAHRNMTPQFVGMKRLVA
jgi:hypothetical protein